MQDANLHKITLNYIKITQNYIVQSIVYIYINMQEKAQKRIITFSASGHTCLVGPHLTAVLVGQGLHEG